MSLNSEEGPAERLNLLRVAQKDWVGCRPQVLELSYSVKAQPSWVIF